MNDTNIMFLGTTACIFDKNDDTPSFLINKKYLFDTGFALVNNLVNNDIDPLSIKYLFFTHMHHDHYISLPSFLFYYMQKGGDVKKLKIIGPAKDVRRIVEKAMSFSESKSWENKTPQIIELEPGEIFETDDTTFETCESIHGVQGICYRITDKNTGVVICATGDTQLNSKLDTFFKECDLLVHEISLGFEENPTIRHGHSTVYEAVNLANCVGAKKLFFVHNSKKIKDDVIEYAKANFQGDMALWPEKGVYYTI